MAVPPKRSLRADLNRMIIPYEKLSPEALDGLIEEFVTRPGTDTGYIKNTLEQNMDMVKSLILG